MSTTLGVLLKELRPSREIALIEGPDEIVQESSNPRNNADTRYSVLCELNYAPLGTDDKVHLERVFNIAEQSQLSRQFWASLVSESKLADNPFINTVSHMLLVMCQDHCDYLQKRFDTFYSRKLFEKMEFSTDHARIGEWAPLTVEGRSEGQPLAATYAAEGADVDFDNLTRQVMGYLKSKDVKLRCGLHVESVDRESDGVWAVKITATGNPKQRLMLRSCFVFLDAGGSALALLQKSGIPEGRDCSGFPVSGLSFRSYNLETA